MKELPGGSALLSAGSQHRPDASVPLSAHQGAAALGNSPINNNLTKSLLSSIVRWGHSRIKQKPEHSLAMLAETLSKCSRLGWQVLLLGQGQYSILDFEHNPVESVLWDFVPKMPNVKKPLKISQQRFSEAFVGSIGQSRKKFDVPNQMSQAKLLNFIGIFDISAEEIADYSTIVSFTEDTLKYLRRSRFGNVEKTDCRGTENPYPVFYTLVFPAGLVNIQNRLGRNVPLEFFIRSGQSLVVARYCIAQMAAGNVDIQDFTTKGLQTTIRSMERTFHVADQSLQTQPKQLTLDNTGRQFSPDNSSTFGTDKTIQMIFGNNNGIVNKLDGLLNLRLVYRLTRVYIAAITTMCVKRDCFINSIRPKRLSADTFMARLSALTMGLARLFGLGWLNNIARWWLGRIGGILREFSYLLGKFYYLFSKLSVFLDKSLVGLKKFSNLLFKFGDAPFIKLFASRCQFLSSGYLAQILSAEESLPLEETITLQFEEQLGMCCKIN